MAWTKLVKTNAFCISCNKQIICKPSDNCTSEQHLDYYVNVQVPRWRAEAPMTAQEKARRTAHIRWMRSYGLDYLIYILGNQCSLCGSQNDLEIDHLFPRLFSRHENAEHPDYYKQIKEYDLGEQLRVLCGDCHPLSHALRI